MQQKNILLCFVDQIDFNLEFDRFIEKFDKEGFEIHILNGIIENNVQPHHVLSILENIQTNESEASRFYFLTNIKDFFFLMYRIYQQSFEQFLYFKDKPVDYSVKLDHIYHVLLSKKVTYQEKLLKPIFTNHKSSNMLPFLENESVVLNEVDDILKGQSFLGIQKYYYYNQSYFLFEPVDGDEKLICLDNEKALPSLSIKNTKIYNDSIQLDQTMGILQELQESRDLFFTYYEEIQKHFDLLKEKILNAPSTTMKLYIKAIELLSKSFEMISQIYVMSFLMNTVPSPRYLNKIYSMVLNNNHLRKEEKYFLLYQCVRIGFVSTNNIDADTAHLNRRLYRTIYNEYKKEIKSNYKFIPKEQRNENLIFVITGQFLNLHHAPTKTALDRCYTLIKHLGKKVILINTKELLTTKKIVPWYNITFGNVFKEYEKITDINYKDIKIPFYQSRQTMPDSMEILNLIETVNKHRPYLILNIGGGSITADLCSLLVPTATLSTVFSGLPLSEGQFHVLGRKINSNDIAFLNEFGFSEANLLESLFTFDFKPQQVTYTKQQLNLPGEKFLIAVVGARLDHEVTEDFLQALVDTTTLGTHLVFIGSFETYSQLVKSRRELVNRITYLGFQDDVLAVMELCHLYANPLRAGGGSSAAEAMFKGLPVVTIGRGDVSVAAGEDFWVNSFEEMKEVIRRYVQDKNFYNTMSIKAKKRAEMLLNTKVEMEMIIDKIQSSELFV